MPHKANAACRHHIPRAKRRVTNWAEYDAARNAPLTVGLALADLLDFLRDGLDALIQPKPVFVKADNQLASSRRNLIRAIRSISKRELRRALAPALTVIPCSMRNAQIWLIVAVRRDTRRDLTRWQACRSS